MNASGWDTKIISEELLSVSFRVLFHLLCLLLWQPLAGRCRELQHVLTGRQGSRGQLDLCGRSG